MMKEMYLNDLDRRRSRTGCLVLLGVLVVALLIALPLWWRRRGDDAPPDARPDAVPAVTETDDAAPPRRTGRERPAPAADDRGREWLEEARAAQSAEQYLRARELGWQILDESNDPDAIEAAEQLLGEVHIELVMTPRPMPEKVDYTIQSGDTLGGLARRFGTTVELIKRGNRLTGPMIRVGDRLRILQADFSMEVSKSRNDLVLKINDRFFKRYRVGTGEYERTPEGDFKITERIAQPTWWRQDGRAIPYGTTNNVLGTHWLSIDVPGYGLHGTWEPESIGYQSSAGCVRLLNEDIEELYTLVPVGVPVTITE